MGDVLNGSDPCSVRPCSMIPCMGTDPRELIDILCWASSPSVHTRRMWGQPLSWPSAKYKALLYWMSLYLGQVKWFFFKVRFSHGTIHYGWMAGKLYLDIYHMGRIYIGTYCNVPDETIDVLNSKYFLVHNEGIDIISSPI